MRLLRGAIAALLAALLMTTAGSPVAVASEPGSVSGQVVVPSGYDPRDVRVQVVPYGGGPFGGYSAWADVNGLFTVTGVPAGDYRVGFATYERDLNLSLGNPAWWTSPGQVHGTYTAAAGFVDAGSVTVESGANLSLGATPVLTHLPVRDVAGTLVAPPGHDVAGTEIRLWYHSSGAYPRPGGWQPVPGVATQVVGTGGAFSFPVLRGYWTHEDYALRVVDPTGTFAFSFANGGLSSTTPGTSTDFGVGSAGLIRVPGSDQDVALGSFQLRLPISGVGTVAITGTRPGDPTRAEWGRTLTAVADVAWSQPSATTSYQWYRNGVAIDGATSPTYDLFGIGDGYGVTFSVRAVPAGIWALDGAPIESAQVTVDNTSPLNRTAPQVVGTAVVGQRLSTTHGSWTPTLAHPSQTFAYTYGYQWFRGESPVPGATGPTYDLSAADFGHRVRVRVSADLLTSSGISNFESPGTAWSGATTPVRAPAVLGVTVRKAPPKRKKGKPRTRIVVTARVLGAPTAGRVRIVDRKKVLRTVALERGRAVLTIRLPKGRHRITAAYVETGLVFHGSAPVRVWRMRR